jgi:hypothetical protein
MQARANYQIKSITSFSNQKRREVNQNSSKFIKTLREEPKTSSARKQAIWAELGRALADTLRLLR